MKKPPLTCAITDPTFVGQEQQSGQEALDLTSDVLASTSSDDQLRNRLDAVTRRLSCLGVRFAG